MVRVRKVKTAAVLLWGKTIGVVAWDDNRRVGSFQYMREFARGGYEIAPLMMPLDESRIYLFPALSKETYWGLPGLLADALPDRYG
ncbi:MAG: HipA N-terminal domain-containing protein, partial [bacterium]